MLTQVKLSNCCGAPVMQRRTPKRGVFSVCKACKYGCKPTLKITECNLIPAYRDRPSRNPATQEGTLDLFYRGWDFSTTDGGAPYTSVRDMAEGAIVQFRHGKRLQKTFVHIVHLVNRK